jgi:hypothetical protein
MARSTNGETDRLFSFIKSHSRCSSIKDPVQNWDSELVAAYQHVKEQPYWSRVWTIQEIVVARNVRIMCGNKSVQWLCFTHFLQLLAKNTGKSFIFRLRDWPTTFTELPIDLAQALDWTDSSLATDGCDKVYAILGLVNKGAGQDIVANYTYSSCTVYCIAIRAMWSDWRKTYYFDDQALLHASDIEMNSGKLSRMIDTIPNACLEARRLETGAQPSEHSRLSKYSRLLKSSGSDCDGLECGSQTVMQNIARWHNL